EGVVRRALAAEQAQDVLSEALRPTALLARRQADRGAVALQEARKGVRSHPHPWLRQVDVGEHAQQARPAAGPAGEVVHVQQVVAGGVAELARRFLLGP